MSSEFSQNTSQYPELRPATPTTRSQLTHSATSALAYVTNDEHVGLENLEPALAVLSAHAQASHDLDAAGHIEDALGAISVDTVAEIAAQSLAAQPLSSLGDGSANTPQSAKAKRLNRACDACSKRKVKCDNERPCKNCNDLEIECTFQRPTKRRGPVNRVAEEIKRLKRGPDDVDFTRAGDDPSTNSLFLALDSIAPYSVVKRLVAQYFTFMYPFFPFPHENLFMENLDRSEFHDSQFLALLASMCALLAASFPRMARSAIIELGDGSLLENNLEAFIERCMLVVSDARGPRFYNSKRFTVNDAATSLFLGITSAITASWSQFSLYMSESDRILQCIKLQKRGGEEPTNFVDLELENRLYSTLFRTTRAISNLGQAYNTLVRPLDPPTPASLPSEIDDFYLYENRIEPQPVAEFPPVVTAANLITNIHIAVCSPTILAATTEPYNETPSSPTLAVCTKTVRNGLEAINRLLASAPASLTSPLGPIDLLDDLFLAPDKRREAQMEVQKAAVKIAAFACRNYLLSWLNIQIQRQNPRIMDSESRDNALLMALTAESDSIEKVEPLRTATTLLQEETASLVPELASFLKTLGVQHVEPNSMSSLTSLHSILPLIHDFLKTNGSSGQTEEADAAVLRDDPAAEDAQFVLLKVDALDKELAAISRGDVLDIGDGALAVEEAPIVAAADNDVVP